MNLEVLGVDPLWLTFQVLDYNWSCMAETGGPRAAIQSGDHQNAHVAAFQYLLSECELIHT
jgi:hypothetical protein